MKKTTLLKTLPAVALALALGACGGGGDSDSSINPGTGGQPPSTGGQQPSSSGSITACFTAPQTVNFALTSSNVPSGEAAVSQSSVGPMTYNGQAVTGQAFFYTSISNSAISKETYYYIVASNGVIMGDVVDTMYDGSTNVRQGNFLLPQNMSPGQTVGNITLVGFETITLAGKTFSNTCHFREINNNTGIYELWMAPGYILIKWINSDGSTVQYNRDL